MLSIYYAKKTSNGYILNFFADSTDDVEAFNPDKSWGMYGKPIPGSVLTVTSNEDVFNYYLNESGALVEIAIDSPAKALTPFSVGQTITGIDFGNVQNGDTSDAMTAFITGLQFPSEGERIVELVMDAEGGSLMAVRGREDGDPDFYVIASYVGEDFAILWANKYVADMEGIEVFEGFQNLTNGKYSFGSTIELLEVNATQGWNGTLIGAVEAEPGPTPSLTAFEVDQSITGLQFDATNTGAQALEDLVIALNTYSGVDANGEVTVPQSTIYSVNDSEATGWNGVIVGTGANMDVIAQNDVVDTYKFNTALTVPQVVNILKDFNWNVSNTIQSITLLMSEEHSGGSAGITVVRSTITVGSEDPDYMIFVGAQEHIVFCNHTTFHADGSTLTFDNAGWITEYYFDNPVQETLAICSTHTLGFIHFNAEGSPIHSPITIMTSTDQTVPDSGVVLYASEAFPDVGITAGWQNLDENGIYDLGGTETVVAISDKEGWNGVFVGVVLE